MEIVKELKCSNSPTSVALGFFDGVHLGHKSVINETVGYAKRRNLIPTVFTLEQSPRSVITEKSIGGIITNDEKLSVFEKLGIQRVYMLDFKTIMGFSAECFVNNILDSCFNAKHTVCGFNYHFGNGGNADKYTLRELCEKRNITVTAQNHIDYNGSPISSTRIRKSITDGDILSVNAMLGREYGFNLPVIHGRKLGRKLGTPTLNQKFPQGLTVPLFGVYASAVTVKSRLYCGVTNIGVKPTVGSDDILIETWLPDYSGEEFYNELVDIRLLEHIREERKFESIDSLKNEIVKNSVQADKIFKFYKKGR